jgi:hypothetical protein
MLHLHVHLKKYFLKIRSSISLHNYKVLLIITQFLGTLERPCRNPYGLSSDNSAGLTFDKNNSFGYGYLYNSTTGAVYLFNLKNNVTALPPRFLLPKHQYKHYFLNIQKSVEAFDPDGRHPNDSLTVLS